MPVSFKPFSLTLMYSSELSSTLIDTSPEELTSKPFLNSLSAKNLLTSTLINKYIPFAN